MDNTIPVKGTLGSSPETIDSSDDATNRASLTEKTVTSKPSNSYLPQTNSHELLPLSLIGFIMCATIVISCGISLIVRKKRSDSVESW